MEFLVWILTLYALFGCYLMYRLQKALSKSIIELIEQRDRVSRIKTVVMILNKEVYDQIEEM